MRISATVGIINNPPFRGVLTNIIKTRKGKNMSYRKLETLYETESLKDEVLYKNLHERLQILGKKINRFIQSVEAEHRTDQ